MFFVAQLHANSCKVTDWNICFVEIVSAPERIHSALERFP